MKISKFLFLLMNISLFMVFSCQVNKKQQLIQKIEQIEQTLNETTKKRPLNKKEVKGLLTLYKNLYRENPKDTVVAGYIMNAAQYTMHSQMYQKAAHYYNIVATDFTNTSHYPMALFMQAFVYDQANDTANAKIYYKKFIKEFPNHKLTDDAQLSLQNLGKNLKEIVDSFDKKARTN